DRSADVPGAHCSKQFKGKAIYVFCRFLFRQAHDKCSVGLLIKTLPVSLVLLKFYRTCTRSEGLKLRLVCKKLTLLCYHFHMMCSALLQVVSGDAPGQKHLREHIRQEPDKPRELLCARLGRDGLLIWLQQVLLFHRGRRDAYHRGR